VWGLVAWGMGKARKMPLGCICRPDGTFATKPEDKGDILFEAYSPTDRPRVDAAQPDNPAPCPACDFQPFTEEELREAIQPTSNTLSRTHVTCYQDQGRRRAESRVLQRVELSPNTTEVR
jgi:hypothetical protein